MMPRRARSSCLALVALVAVQPAVPGVAVAAGKQPTRRTPPAVAATAAETAPRIEIRRRPPDPEREARERAERERVRAELPAWCAAYREARPRLHRALAETDHSLTVARGPWSRNVCYALRLEIHAFVRRVPSPPDPELAVRLRHALAVLGEAANACSQGLPTVAQLRLQPGLRELARFEAEIAGCGAAAGRLEPRPGF